jgi:hypothetical protein
LELWHGISPLRPVLGAFERGPERRRLDVFTTKTVKCVMVHQAHGCGLRDYRTKHSQEPLVEPIADRYTIGLLTCTRSNGPSRPRSGRLETFLEPDLPETGMAPVGSLVCRCAGAPMPQASLGMLHCLGRLAAVS